MRETVLSYLVTLCLALSIAAGSAMAGFAQGQPERQMGPLTEMVICASDGGTAVIFVDSSGNRVDPDRHCDALPCSNCLSLVAFYLPPVLPNASFTRNALRVRAEVQHVNLRSFTAFHTAARGPPVEV